MGGKRIRFQVSYVEGAGSDLERALLSAGVDTANISFITKLLTLGALSWAQGATLLDGRDGLKALFPGVASRPHADPGQHERSSSMVTNATPPAASDSNAAGPKDSNEVARPDSSSPSEGGRQPSAPQESDRGSQTSASDQSAVNEPAPQTGQSKASASDSQPRNAGQKEQRGDTSKGRGEQGQEKPSSQHQQGRQAPQPAEGKSEAQDRTTTSEGRRPAAGAGSVSTMPAPRRVPVNNTPAPASGNDEAEDADGDEPHDPAKIDLDSLLPKLGM